MSGTMEADSEQIAENLLWQADLIVSRVRKVRKAPGLHNILPSVFGVKERDVLALVRQLATLLESGLNLVLSLETLGHGKVHPQIRESVEGIIQTINDGGQMSDGMAKYASVFPGVFIRLARIGEQTGDLSAVLRRGADYLENQAAVKSKLKSSLTYPAIVSVTAGISIFILIKFSIPMLSGLLDEFGADMPLSPG